jgi:hypothetical protein
VSAETNKATARRLCEEAITRQRPEVLQEVIAADAIDEMGSTAGREGLYLEAASAGRIGGSARCSRSVVPSYSAG